MADEIARQLRKRMTPQEIKLWVHLRSWRERGFHFRRQAPRARYVVDFVCIKHRLVIELDGGQHNFDKHAKRDTERDLRLSQAGYRVLRFWNHEVDQNLEGVLAKIDETLRLPPPPAGFAGTLPQMGEG